MNYEGSARPDRGAPSSMSRCAPDGFLPKPVRTPGFAAPSSTDSRGKSWVVSGRIWPLPDGWTRPMTTSIWKPRSCWEPSMAPPHTPISAAWHETRKDAYLQSCDRPALAANFTTAALPIDVADLRRSAANTRAVRGSSTELAGLPSSAGIARGHAKLVLRPDVTPDDCAGRILVARETDPGWLPLMLNASGLVVERGSMVSHTAITGRMLGIPTVVAVSGRDHRNIRRRRDRNRRPVGHRSHLPPAPTETAVTSCNYRSTNWPGTSLPQNMSTSFASNRPSTSRCRTARRPSP